MRELAKAVSVVVLMFVAPASAVAWLGGILNAPDWVVPTLKYAGPVLCVIALTVLLVIHNRPDEVPDFLAKHVRRYFNRGGLCFGVRTTVADGECVLVVFFQNQYTGRCVGRIALRPAREFFLNRADISPVAIEVECGPAAFGVARVPLGVPLALQGRRQRFEVGASVAYPSGRGRQVRFRDGTVLSANSDFGNAFGTGLMVAGALTGQIVYTRPAEIARTLPHGVAESIKRRDALASVVTLWELGDPMPTDERGGLPLRIPGVDPEGGS